MSLSKPNSHYQNLEQSENQRRPTSSRSTPIACRVCDKVFFDNVSLVLHFECHLENETSIPRQHGRDLSSLQSDRHLALSLSPFSSSVERMCEAHHAVLPRMNECLRPCPFPISSAITPNLTPRPRDVSPVQIPALNSLPPINASSDARWNLSQPIHHSTMSHYAATSSTHPLMYSQSGARSFAYGSAPVPPFQIRGQNWGQGRFSDRKDPHIKEPKKPIQEIIIISDDDEDDNNNEAEIDLTLKL